MYIILSEVCVNAPSSLICWNVRGTLAGVYEMSCKMPTRYNVNEHNKKIALAVHVQCRIFFYLHKAFYRLWFRLPPSRENSAIWVRPLAEHSFKCSNTEELLWSKIRGQHILLNFECYLVDADCQIIFYLSHPILSHLNCNMHYSLNLMTLRLGVIFSFEHKTLNKKKKLWNKRKEKC